MRSHLRAEVIDDIHRHGMTWAGWWESDRRRPNSAYALVHRMVCDGILGEHPLFGRVRYQRLAGAPALGPQQLRMAFAIGQWCHLEGYLRPHRWERHSAYPWLPERFTCAVGPEGLAIFKVDMGGKPDALVRKAERTHVELSRIPGYLASSPVVYILTAAKGEEINHYIARSEHRRHLRASLIPLYDRLTGEIHHARQLLPSGR